MNSDPKQKTADLLSICFKAGKAVKGFDSAADAVKNGNAFCVLLASDASAKTAKEADFICGAVVRAAKEQGLRVPVQETILRLVHAMEGR